MTKQIIVLFSILITKIGLSQVWNYPYSIYPYQTYSLNEFKDENKGIQSKTFVIAGKNDTSRAYFAYDKKGRVIETIDEYGFDTTRYGYEKSDVWVYLFGTEGDTIANRVLSFGKKKFLKQIVYNYPRLNLSSTFKVECPNDTVKRTYSDEKLEKEFLFDKRGRIKSVLYSASNSTNRFEYSYGKDTVFYQEIIDEKVVKSVFGVFKNKKLILIDSQYNMNRHFHDRIIMVYDKKNRIIFEYSEIIDETGHKSDRRLTDEYFYNKKGHLDKHLIHNLGADWTVFVNYNYF